MVYAPGVSINRYACVEGNFTFTSVSGHILFVLLDIAFVIFGVALMQIGMWIHILLEKVAVELGVVGIIMVLWRVTMPYDINFSLYVMYL